MVCGELELLFVSLFFDIFDIVSKFFVLIGIDFFDCLVFLNEKGGFDV